MLSSINRVSLKAVSGQPGVCCVRSSLLRSRWLSSTRASFRPTLWATTTLQSEKGSSVFGSRFLNRTRNIDLQKNTLLGGRSLIRFSSSSAEDEKSKTAANDDEKKQNKSSSARNENITLSSISEDVGETSVPDPKGLQDFWLKMCSNKDPNDNTVYPDAFTETKRESWSNEDGVISSDGFSGDSD